MADLVFSGMLTLIGDLNLEAGGGTVKVDSLDMLVEGATNGTPVPPVILPPPPASPIDTGTGVEVISSFNKNVTAGGTYIVALGIVMQGDTPTWPGMMLLGESTVEINGISINVANDQATIFPSGGIGILDTSGQ